MNLPHGNQVSDAQKTQLDDFYLVVARAYDFGAARTIVDVGGGYGLLLSTILEEFPNARGVLLDVPSVAAGTHKRIAAAGLSLRCDVIGGDFLVSVPAGDDGGNATPDH